MFSLAEKRRCTYRDQEQSSEENPDHEGWRRNINLASLATDISEKHKDDDAEAEDKGLLDADADHVRVQAAHDVVQLGAGARRHDGAADLHDKGEHVEDDKRGAVVPGLELEDGAVGVVAPDEAAKDHVDVGVCPDGGDEDEDEPQHVVELAVGREDAQVAEDVRGDLQRARHDNDPAVPGAVEEGLGDVQERDAGKEDGEDDRGAHGRAKVPLGALGREGFARHGGGEREGKAETWI